MYQALLEAKKAFNEGEIPIGCVIVYDNKIIARTHNTKQQSNNSINHAEMLALNQAMGYLKTKYLYGCTMYLTIEPCAMCAGAMLNCRLEKLVYGAKEPRYGCGGSVYNLFTDKNLPYRTKVESGIMEEECAKLMQDFFALRRKEKNVNCRTR